MSENLDDPEAEKRFQQCVEEPWRIDAAKLNSNAVGTHLIEALKAERHLEDIRNKELIRKVEESGRHHWSATPVFWLTLIAAVAAVAGAWFSYRS